MKFVGIVHYEHGRKSIEEKDREKSIEMATICVFSRFFQFEFSLTTTANMKAELKRKPFLC